MILSKNQLVDNISNELSDNSTGKISPYDIRHNLLDIIDSVHLLTIDKELNGLNVGTPDTRSTRLGQHTLEKINLEGYSSVDNSAFGYSALKSNHQGSRNTAIGSLSLSCNIYGEDNVGAGFSSLGGNTTGFGNVGIGNYSLQSNKIGHFNVAIGHGAGYYVDRNTNKKLIIASHAINEEYICSNPVGSGLNPLIYGDFDNLSLGIGVRSLHGDGALQVSGNITPSHASAFNLGTSSYRFLSAFLTNYVSFASGTSIGYDYEKNGIYANTSLYPSTTLSHSLGSSDRKWLGGHFENIYVSGNAFINQLSSIYTSVYNNKTLFLASLSGASTVSGYLSDELLDNAGFIVKASGTSYLRDYEFVFKPSGYNSIACLEKDNAYSRSHWKSNISLDIASGCHVKTQRVVSSGKLSLVTDPDCYGIYLNSNYFYLSRSNVLEIPAHSSSGLLAGISNVNFLANSGSSSDYGVTYAALESGVNVSQKFLTGSKVRVKDISNSNKDKLRGFELKYFDDSSINYVGPLSDRFVVSSYDNTSYPVNNFIVMKNASDGGVVGINNFTSGGELLLPKTTLNVRSSSNAIVRVTAENGGNVQSSIQLLGGQNCLRDGLELTYSHTSGIADLNIYESSGKTIFLRFNENKKIGLLSSGITNSMLTIGTSGLINDISLRETLVAPTATEYYPKIFASRVNKLYANQINNLSYLDSSGNTHDLVVNKLDQLDGRALYTDDYNNTFGGYKSIESRKLISSLSLKPSGNTALGAYALRNLNASGNYNTVIGSYTGSGINTGKFNTIIGAHSANNLSSGNRNIIIGSFVCNNAFTGNFNNIIIGNSGFADGFSGSYKFLVGDASNTLLEGTLGPTISNKKLTMPSGGKLYLDSFNGSGSLYLRDTVIETIDRNGNKYPHNSLIFRFSGNDYNDLLLLNSSGTPYSGVAIYASGTGPYAVLNGDLRIRKNINFSDLTSLNSASFLDDITAINNSGITTRNIVNSFTVEGYAQNTIEPPSNPMVPTTGLLISKDGLWGDSQSVTLFNRDQYLKINKNDYVVAIKINNQYRPIWVSSESTVCECCNK
jgi:hypothetical protein